MNAARQRLRRVDRATEARTRSASPDCIVRTVSFGSDPLKVNGNMMNAARQSCEHFSYMGADCMEAG